MAIGTWYTKIIKYPVDFSTSKCIKTEYKRLNASAFIQLQEWRYKKDNVFERANATDLVTDTPGRFIEYENELPSPGPAPVVILYTDYTNIMVHYSCKTYGGWFSKKKQEYYYISVRSTLFNDLELFLIAFEKIKSLNVNFKDLVLMLDEKSC